MNKSSILSIDELLHRAGYRFNSTIKELTDSNKNIYSSGYTRYNIESEVKIMCESNDPDTKKQVEIDLIESKLNELKSNFIDKEFVAGGLANFPEINHLLYFGFDVRQKNATITIQEMFNYMGERHMLINLCSIEKDVMALPMVNPSYHSKRYSQLSIDELQFEALEFVIDGAMHAVWYNEMKARKGQLDNVGTNAVTFDEGKASSEPLKKESGKYFHALMKLYFENGCKGLNDLQVAGIAQKNKELRPNKLNAEHNKLAEHNYKNVDQATSVKRFAALYVQLINEFKSINPTALKEVSLRYEILKEGYPSLDI